MTPPGPDRPLPALDRETGRISFPPSADPEHAAGLCELLLRHGVRADVPDGWPPAVRLAGIPNLDLVEAVILDWYGGPPPTARTPRPAAGNVGRVHVVHRIKGRAAVDAGPAGFAVVELMADRGLEAGDELAWDALAGLGVAVYENRTRGTRLKVYVLARGLSLAQAVARLTAD